VPPRNNPDEIALETLNTVLGGQFSARLNMNLREDKHWSYGAGSALIGAKGERPFVVYAPVQTDKTKESLGEVAKELRGIRGERPVTPQELAFAQKGQTLTLPGRWETGAAISGDVGEIVRYGLDDRYFDTYAAKVDALTLRDVNGAAGVLHPDKMIWVVVGDRAKVEAGVREMKLGVLRGLDADGNVLPESR
jgi:zinc protease